MDLPDNMEADHLARSAANSSIAEAEPIGAFTSLGNTEVTLQTLLNDMACVHLDVPNSTFHEAIRHGRHADREELFVCK